MMMLLMATMLAAPIMAAERYNIDVVAIYAGHEDENSTACTNTNPLVVENIIEDTFAANALRKLRGSNPGQTPINGRHLDCTTFCKQYPPMWCEFYSDTGECNNNGRRNLEVSLAQDEHDFPAEVHDRCEVLKSGMIEGLRRAAVSSVVDDECKGFILDEWKLDCFVRETMVSDGLSDSVSEDP